MFKRLFGETDEEQLRFLQPRAIITLVSLVLCFFGPAAIIAVVMIFVWGWGVVKSLFGIASIGAIFSGNVVLGSAIFVLYILLSYIAGIVCAVLGTCRYVYLKIKSLKKCETQHGNL